jgi:hypothetical protein
MANPQQMQAQAQAGLRAAAEAGAGYGGTLLTGAQAAAAPETGKPMLGS